MKLLRAATALLGLAVPLALALPGPSAEAATPLQPTSTAAKARQTSATDTRLKVLTINVFGAKGHRGAVSPVVGLVSDAIARETNGADVVGLQELCWDQYAGLKAKLEPKGWQLRFNTATSSEVGCGHRTADSAKYGNAVLVRTNSEIMERERFNLPNPAERQGRVVMCLDAKLKGVWVRVCNSHLDYSDAGNPVQAKYLADLMKAEKTENTYLIMTGDVNFTYTTNPQESYLAGVLPGEKRPAAADLPSVDRIKFSGATMGSSSRYSDSRTDHKVYTANVYLVR